MPVSQGKNDPEKISHGLLVFMFVACIAMAVWIVTLKNTIKAKDNYIDRQRTTIAAISKMNNDLGGNIREVASRKFK